MGFNFVFYLVMKIKKENFIPIARNNQRGRYDELVGGK